MRYVLNAYDTNVELLQQVRGWVLDTPAHAPGNTLPVGHTLFDGISVVKCEMRESDVLCAMRDAPRFPTAFPKAAPHSHTAA